MKSPQKGPSSVKSSGSQKSAKGRVTINLPKMPIAEFDKIVVESEINFEQTVPPEEKKIGEDLYGIPKQMFEVLDQEMRCGICLNVYNEPIELPCYHVFCLDCLRR